MQSPEDDAAAQQVASESSSGAEEAADTPGEPIFRGLGKHALTYGLGMLISRALAFIMLPIYTRYLTPADYGVMGLIEMTLDFISIIGGAELALGVFRFYHKSDDEQTRREVVATSFALVGGLYAVVGIGVFLFAGTLSELLFRTDAHTMVVQIAAANVALQSLSIVPMSLVRVRDLSTMYVSLGVARLFLQLSLNILFIVFMGLGILGVFLSSLIANTVVGGGLTVWLYRQVGTRVSRKWTGDLIRYGVPLMGMQVATFITTFSDRYFLQAISDEAIVGLYNLAYQFGFLLVSVGFFPVAMVWGPKRFQAARGDNYNEDLARGFNIMNTMVLTTAVGIAVYVRDVLRIMADPAFHSAADVVPLILVAYVFQCWASIQDVGILVRERTEYLTLANVLAGAVALVGYALLIPRYLEWGAATATVLAFGTRYGFTFYFSQRLWPVRYDWRAASAMGVWSLAIAAVSLVLPDLSILPSLTVRTALIGVFFVGVWLLPILWAEDREVIRRLAGSFARRATRKGSP